MSLYRDVLRPLAEMLFWILAVWGVILLLASAMGCSGPQGLLNYIPTRSFEQRTQQELKDFVAETVANSSSSVTNDIVPLIWGGGIMYLGAKLMTTVTFWFQNSKIRKAINGGVRRE